MRKRGKIGYPELIPRGNEGKFPFVDDPSDYLRCFERFKCPASLNFRCQLSSLFQRREFVFWSKIAISILCRSNPFR